MIDYQWVLIVIVPTFFGALLYQARIIFLLNDIIKQLIESEHERLREEVKYRKGSRPTVD